MELLSYREARGVARVGDRTLRQAVYEGKLTAYKIGGSVRIDRRDLEAWILSQRRGASVPKAQAGRAGE